MNGKAQYAVEKVETVEVTQITMAVGAGTTIDPYRIAREWWFKGVRLAREDPSLDETRINPTCWLPKDKVRCQCGKYQMQGPTPLTWWVGIYGIKHSHEQCGQYDTVTGEWGVSAVAFPGNETPSDSGNEGAK